MVAKTVLEQSYVVFSLDEIQEHLFSLGKSIRASKETFDRVVALARGGVSIAQTLSDLIGVKHISVIQSEMYSGIYEKSSPIIITPLATSIRGEKILLIDDLADSGETLLFARDYLQAHGPASVRTATLAVKPWTKVMPDFSALRSEAWIIFPWELRETIQTLDAMWRKKGQSRAFIQEQLVSLGYRKDQIETFSQS